ncbi:hypothetical protein CIHG_03259 [Coccidioides immitis H538.4]|uniref:Uncharacterized protein n=1 Tax=Coccidioides immitis H538.4 TaxID=396776 RepID=A0A0J8RKY0_COCIT|nr:hypothetical protein CIHG_03259 [Coccidioides immitis H538.4]TPX26201.1 hypothetical protein DIZ76_011662 [Coccidioides immitis]
MHVNPSASERLRIKAESTSRDLYDKEAPHDEVGRATNPGPDPYHEGVMGMFEGRGHVLQKYAIVLPPPNI